MNDFTWSEQIAHRDVLGISDHDEEAWIFESKPNFPTIRLLVSVIDPSHHAKFKFCPRGEMFANQGQQKIKDVDGSDGEPVTVANMAARSHQLDSVAVAEAEMDAGR